MIRWMTRVRDHRAKEETDWERQSFPPDDGKMGADWQHWNRAVPMVESGHQAEMDGTIGGKGPSQCWPRGRRQ